MTEDLLIENDCRWGHNVLTLRRRGYPQVYKYDRHQVFGTYSRMHSQTLSVWKHSRTLNVWDALADVECLGHTRGRWEFGTHSLKLSVWNALADVECLGHTRERWIFGTHSRTDTHSLTDEQTDREMESMQRTHSTDRFNWWRGNEETQETDYETGGREETRGGRNRDWTRLN